MPKYMSPTSLSTWYSDRDKFYLYYLCPHKPPRDPQTPPMAVGSAFDAKVKSFLVERLLGKRPEFEFDTLFTQQVEQHNRDTALAAGNEVFDVYNKVGALSDLLLDLQGVVGQPRFEASIEAPVTSQLHIGAVPFLGKPDIYFITKFGARVIFDWKVNGYYSNSNVSPKPGYVRQRTTDPKINGRSHDKAMVMAHQGMKIAISHPLCTVDGSWAAQLSVYAWLLGEGIGAQFITAIDQIAVGKHPISRAREYRVAQHRSTVTEKFQHDTFALAHKAWHQIQSGHIFDDVSKEESDARCGILDAMATAPRDPVFDDIVR